MYSKLSHSKRKNQSRCIYFKKEKNSYPEELFAFPRTRLCFSRTPKIGFLFWEKFEKKPTYKARTKTFLKLAHVEGDSMPITFCLVVALSGENRQS